MRNPIPLVITIIGAALWLLWPFHTGVLWGGLLALGVHPVFARVHARHRAGVAFASAATLLVFVSGVMALAAHELEVAARLLVPWWKAESSGHWPVPPWLERIPLLRVPAVAGWEHLTESLTHPLASWPARIPDILRVLQGAGGVAKDIIVACVLFFFLLKESAEIRVGYGRFLDMLPPEIHNALEASRETLLSVEWSAFFGIIGEIAVLWAVYGVSGVPHPLLLATFCALVAIVPIAGTLAVVSVGGFLLLFREDWVSGIVATILALTVLGLADNLGKPALARVLSKGNRVPSVFWLVAGMLSGVAVLGIPGVFLGPALLAAPVSLWRGWVTEGTPTEIVNRQKADI